jgi:hypothetical protein
MAEVLFLVDPDGYLTVHKRGCMDVTKTTLRRSAVWFHGEAEHITDAIEQGWHDFLKTGEVSWRDAVEFTTIEPCAGLSMPAGRPKRGRAIRARNLPFDPDTSPDDVVLTAVIGKTVHWENSLSGGMESARVGRRAVSPHTHLRATSTGRRVLTFVDDRGNAGTGFRSVALDSIVRVR